MTATREWRAPTRLGTTLHLVGDLHSVVPADAGYTRTESLRHDMLRLTKTLPPLLARVQVGDCIHNLDGTMGQSSTQLFAALDLLKALNADGTPLVGVLGNHDVNNSGDANALVKRYGRHDLNYWVEHGPFRFVCYTAANLNETGCHPGATTSWTVPLSTLNWLADAVSESELPVILVSHCPPYEQYADNSTGYFLEPRASVTALLNNSPNVIAWLSGHRHHWYNDPNLFKVATFTNNHKVALIQAGCCGGTLDEGQRPTMHPVQKLRPNGSVFATYFEATDTASAKWEIRVRDHSLGVWGTPPTGYQYKWTLTA